MNKYQKWLVVSFVFLAAALIFPVYILYTSSIAAIQTAVKTIPNYAANNPQSAGLSDFLNSQTAAQTELLIIVIIVEAVLAAVFAVTLLYAIRCRDQCRNFPPPA